MVALVCVLTKKMKSKTLNNRYKLSNNEGYITLISVLILGAAGLVIVISLALLSLGSSRSSLALEQSNQAQALADTCAEMALQYIWDWDANIGTDNLNLGQGSCTYTITSETVPKVITASGTVGNIVKKVLITVDNLHPYVHLSSWQEVAD